VKNNKLKHDEQVNEHKDYEINVRLETPIPNRQEVEEEQTK
jgi:hypothetical protein